MGEGQTAVVTPEDVNREYVRQFGAPGDGQLTNGPELEAKAREAIQTLSPYVKVD